MRGNRQLKTIFPKESFPKRRLNLGRQTHPLRFYVPPLVANLSGNWQKSDADASYDYSVANGINADRALEWQQQLTQASVTL